MAPADHYLLRLSRKFNRTQVSLFTRSEAINVFFGRIGLTLRKPLIIWGNDQSRLTPLAEKHHFEALHFLKYRIYQALKSGDIHWARFWYAYYTPIRNRIVSANYGLTAFCVNRTSSPSERDSLLSQARLILIEAADDFDPWTSTKFSTFACYVILRGFGRVSDALIQSSLDPSLLPQPEPPDNGVYLERLKVILADNRACLSTIERVVIQSRFGFDAPPQTLEHLGQTYGVTKERIRQIQVAALKKLRKAIDNDPFLK